MASETEYQQDRAVALLTERGMARLTELTDAGITAATISRMERKGTVIRLARGLYQLPDAPLDEHHSLAEAAKLVPRGIVCLQSALAFHDLTDRIPPSVWMAIGLDDWRPRIKRPPIQVLRFAPDLLTTGVETHRIEGIDVRIFSPAKTVVDEFRVSDSAGRLHRDSRGYNLNAAIEGLRNALRQRKATPADIARFASEAGPKTWKFVRPYLEAMTTDG